jgi:hypothetical protein
MYFVLMFGVMLILSVHYLFEKQVGTWNLKSQGSCALDHFFYPLMF